MQIATTHPERHQLHLHLTLDLYCCIRISKFYITFTEIVHKAKGKHVLIVVHSEKVMHKATTHHERQKLNLQITLLYLTLDLYR